MDDVVKTIKKHLKKRSYRGEESVRSQICYPILQELGWHTSLPDHVEPEYNIDNTRKYVDIALYYPPDRPIIFIEVKALGNCSAQGEEQLFDYAARKGGVPMIIFTDGDEWHFYNSYGAGNYESRKVKTIQLTEDDSENCVKYFRRYLDYDRVKTKEALKDLVSDHEQIEKKREAKLKIPEAWRLLVNDSDEILVDSIVEKVKELSGGEHTPGKEDVAEFLKGLKPARQPVAQTMPESGKDPQQETHPGTEAQEKVVHQYKINERIHSGRHGKDVYIKVLDYVLAEYERFEELKNQKFNKMKSRAFGTGYHISEKGDEIPKKTEHKTQLARSGKWVNTNLSAENMSTRLVKIGEFYNRVERRKILGTWGSGAEVEFDIPTRPSSS